MKYSHCLFVIILLLVLWPYPFVSAQSNDYYYVTVLGARIKPLKDDGRCWDFRCSKKAKRGLMQAHKRVKQLVAKHTFKQLKKLAAAKGLTALASLDPTGVSLALAFASIGLKSIIAARTLPDPYAILQFSRGDVIKTHSVKDTLTPDWGVKAKVLIKPGDGLHIRVIDKDFRRDDQIASRFVSIPRRHLQEAKRKGHFLWTIKRLSQMYRLDLLIRPVGGQNASRFSAGLYRITISRASIRSHKKSGKHWDIWRGRPDPFVVAVVGRHVFRTHVVKNSFGPIWNVTKTIRIKRTDRLTLNIYDKDLRRNDHIGSCSLSFSRMRLQDERFLVLPCGQARQITLKFDKIK